MPELAISHNSEKVVSAFPLKRIGHLSRCYSTTVAQYYTDDNIFPAVELINNR